MSLDEKRQRFRCRQKSSGYCSYEGDADIREIEIGSEKEDSVILSACLEENDMNTCGAFRLSQNKVDESETLIDQYVDTGLSVDINSKWDDGAANALRCCKEPGNSSDINCTEADEAIGTMFDNSNKLGLSSDLPMPNAEMKKDYATDKCESAVCRGQDDIDGIYEHIKSRGLHLNTTVSSSRSQSVSSDDYRVEQTELKVKDVVPSNHPQLCSTPTADNGAAFTQPKEDCDGPRSSTSSSTSSLASNMSDYKIMKRNSAIVKIDGHTNFFRVQTVKYMHHKKYSKQHYMKKLHDKNKEVEGDIGLRPGDLLLEAQGKSLEDRSQKDVLHIFKKIKQNENGKIPIKLVFRRWEEREENGTKRTYEVDYELKLVLAPDSPDSTPETHQRKWPKVFEKHKGRLHRQYTFKVEELTQHETGWKKELPKGQIDDITPRGQEDHRIQSMYFGDEGFITVDHDGLVSLKAWDGSTASENVFTFTYFRGIDRSQEPLSTYIYCARISCPGPTDVRYLTSNLHSHNEVILQTSPIQTVAAPGDIDETCFILREIGREVLFESLLHRGFYVGCRREKDRSASFVMTEKTQHEVINDEDLENVTFKQWPVKEEQERGSGIFNQVFQSLLSCAGNRSNLVAKR